MLRRLASRLFPRPRRLLMERLDEAFGGDGIASLGWFNTPHSALDGKAPGAVCAAGGWSRVHDLVTAEFGVAR